jgi:uncharacterized protein involved in exopolysaccharide biosynthesis
MTESQDMLDKMQKKIENRKWWMLSAFLAGGFLGFIGGNN